MKGEPNPYRFFFTLGWILASVGVLLWPLFHFRLITTYPNVLHARIMIQGFVACHMFGFLCTALPQILETIPFTRLETVLSAIGLTAVVILHSLKQTVWADALFALVLAVFIVRAAWRGTIRLCMPPPGMVSVGCVGDLLTIPFSPH